MHIYILKVIGNPGHYKLIFKLLSFGNNFFFLLLLF